MSIKSNIERLQNEIADACARARRGPSEVSLMAVSKVHPAEAIVEAYESGQRLFGENRVQEWQTKRATLASLFDPTRSSSPPAQVHLIGPLQNNKTSKAAQIFDAVDTIDSLKTAERLNAAAQSFGKVVRILIEVKLSPEPTKHGIAPGELTDLLHGLLPMEHLKPHGLMTVPPFDEDPETARPCFQQLRRLRDEHLEIFPTLTELSMGMSNDFVVAIEEGSTIVRLGTAIFGKRIQA